MKTLRALIPVLLFAAFGTAGCPCPRIPDPCGVSVQAIFFLAADADFIQQLVGNEAYLKSNVKTDEAREAACRQTFTDLIQGSFCPPKVNQFCVDRCADGEARDMCKGDDRLQVEKVCYQAGIRLFVQYVPSCDKLWIDGTKLYWRAAGGQ